VWGDQADSGSGGSSTVKIGYVTPQTGSLAPFGEADAFVVAQVKKLCADKVLKVGGKKVKVEILIKDSQSDSKRAGDVASDLILQQGVNPMLVSSTPDTTNPVSDQCETNGVPCISTVAAVVPRPRREP
jgi:branched-chain amino acid transport system substrate-binding protein